MGNFKDNNESNYRREMEGLVTWCNENNLSLNVSKTKELIIDFRKKGRKHAPIYINRNEVERAKSIKFLGVTITDNVSWTSYIDTTIKKAQQHFFFLSRLRKFGMSIRSQTNFYRCTTERILSRCKMAWYGNCSALDCKKLQKVMCTAQTITEANLPSMDSIYLAHCRGKAANIIKDPSHPSNDLLQPFLSGRRYRSLNACTSSFSNSFCPAVMILMNRVSRLK
ncbi:uncharacterized protein LOC125485591 [Rhincodon typus]|uniref:uncharacterized protein LOC125485591 n=1 Tax=Rhincodon typus TaxID=259920 RepID=UPI00202F7143|nr:uncharacterized protein LOC125485591 [Rhincodon typus]